MVAAMKTVVGRSENYVHMLRLATCDSDGEVAGVLAVGQVLNSKRVYATKAECSKMARYRSKGWGKVLDRGAAHWENGKGRPAPTARGPGEEVTIEKICPPACYLAIAVGHKIDLHA